MKTIAEFLVSTLFADDLGLFCVLPFIGITIPKYGSYVRTIDSFILFNAPNTFSTFNAPTHNVFYYVKINNKSLEIGDW